MSRFERKIPVPLKVEDLASLARLIACRADYIPPLFYLTVDEKHILSHLFTIPLDKYGLPLLAYVETSQPPGQYIVYTPLEHEEARFSTIPETGRYISYPIIEIKPTPSLVKTALTTPFRRKIRGLEAVYVKSVDSLMRLVSAMIDEASSPPVWCFKNKGKYVLGVIYPVYEYYDSAALPIFHYTELAYKPPAPFISYKPTVEGSDIKYSYSLSDTRFVYGRIIFVDNFPFEL